MLINKEFETEMIQSSYFPSGYQMCQMVHLQSF